MSDEPKIVNMAGRARRQHVSAKWVKRPGDERPCSKDGCKNEGMYIPVLTIWGKDDPGRTKRYAMVVVPVVLCKDHAVMDANEHPLTDDARGNVKELLNGREPDFDNVVVQFFGNRRCRVDRAFELANEKAGAYEHYYDQDVGALRTRKVK
ncbi:MAG TPA: hypothetical protein VF161_04335 [Steroidobacteraceae bacterium]